MNQFSGYGGGFMNSLSLAVDTPEALPNPIPDEMIRKMNAICIGGDCRTPRAVMESCLVCEDVQGENLVFVVSKINELLLLLTDEQKNKAQFYCGYDSSDLTIRFSRLETPEEVQNRLISIYNGIIQTERRERDQLESLKAKYEK